MPPSALPCEPVARAWQSFPLPAGVCQMAAGIVQQLPAGIPQQLGGIAEQLGPGVPSPPG